MIQKEYINKDMWTIPWAKPDYWGNEIKYVNEALESTWISGGIFIDKFEQSILQIFDKKYAFAVSNGTSAIHLAYLGLGLQPKDEVIVPGFGFMAVANIALHMGLKPIFAEVDKDTWCLSVKELPKYITEKTKAIVPVHIYGNVCDMDEIMKIADAYNIPVVEDCAESFCSQYAEKYSGTFGMVNTFSFQATKTITTGEGGMVITDSDRISKYIELYRSHGMLRKDRHYWHELPGHNFRLTNFQAAMGLAQLEKIDTILTERKRVYLEYKKHLEKADGLAMQKIEKNVKPVVWAIAIQLDEEAFPQSRDIVMKQMKKAGIETRPGFYASSMLDIYEKHILHVCENVSRNVISLPSFPTLKNEQIEFICHQLLKLKK